MRDELETLLEDFSEGDDREYREFVEHAEKVRGQGPGEQKKIKTERTTTFERRRLKAERAMRALPSEVYEQLPAEEIARRLLRDPSYDPMCPYEEWDSNCHPDYALKGKHEREDIFWDAMCRYGVRGYRNGKNVKVVQDAIAMANGVKALYGDWILAQVIKAGNKTVYPTMLKSKYALMFYRQWIAEGKFVPANVRIRMGEK